MEIEAGLQDLYDSKRAALGRCLLRTDELDNPQMREMVRKYTAAMEPNYLVWVAAGAINARSPQGRFAASERFNECLQKGHQGMLRDFAASIDCTPNADDYRAVEPAVKRMGDEIWQMNGLTNIALLTYLEHTSRIVIPYMVGIARQLGNPPRASLDTDPHGDVKNELGRTALWALGYERKFGYDQPHQVIREATIAGGLFLRDVLGLRAQPD